METDKLKIMFVDDEENTRNLLRIVLDWDSLGFEVAGEAASGQEGLNLMEELNPDIVITDIKMPYMDGLEFAGLAVENHPLVKVIVLTAYEEFEYAKQGIKMGVSDFLLKPVKRLEIKESVERIRRKILAERSNREEYNKVREKLKESLPVLREKFLNELVLSKNLAQDIDEKLEYYNLTALANHFQVAMVSIGDLPDVRDEENVIVHRILYIDTIKQYFKSDKDVIVFTNNSGNTVIINTRKSINLYECCEHIKTLIVNKLKCDISIGVGDIYTDLNKIHQAYREAVEALKYKLIYGNNIVIRYSDVCIDRQKGDSNLKIDIDMEEILFYIRAGVAEKSTALIREKFRCITGTDSLNINEIRVLGISMTTSIISTISEFPLNLGESFRSVSEMYSYILALTNIPEIELYIVGMAEKLTNSIKQVRENMKKSQMNNILIYVDDNISNPELSLSALASRFYINPSYLSRTFKQHTGCTFVEYLTKLRIQKAIELFESYDVMAYEVAEKVGIPDPNYFGKCFKKYTGYSVNDYKKQSGK
jgi:two-component system response regulator YesN